MRSVTKHILIFFSVFFTYCSAFSSHINVVALEKEIFEWNNSLQFKRSQATLFGLLDNEKLDSDDRYHVYRLLSYTYKRLSDYESTLKFLKKANDEAAHTKNKVVYEAQIAAEIAFVYFDIQEYQKSSKLIDSLSNMGFKDISATSKAKLIMQQAYMLFLDKKFARSEILYNEAITIMQKVEPCELPLAYVKKMQLYNAMDSMDRALQAYNLSMHYSDSCHIIKFSIYAKEELLTIYARRENYRKVAQLNNEIDSLNFIYKKGENLAGLHNQQQQLNLARNNQKIHKEKIHQVYLIVGLAIALVFLLAGSLLAVYYWRKKKRFEAEFVHMKVELAQYISKINALGQEKETIQELSESQLTERQREVLNLLTQGKSNKEIAATLNITEHTVKYHIRIIYQALSVKDRKDLFNNLDGKT